MTKRQKLNVLTVDAGPDRPARFYRLIVGGRGADQPVSEDLLVPDGDELKILHRHENHGEAA